MNDEQTDTIHEGLAVRRQTNQLRRRALRHPDPRDPDALDDDELERLVELEDWEP